MHDDKQHGRGTCVHRHRDPDRRQRAKIVLTGVLEGAVVGGVFLQVAVAKPLQDLGRNRARKAEGRAAEPSAQFSENQSLVVPALSSPLSPNTQPPFSNRRNFFGAAACGASIKQESGFNNKESGFSPIATVLASSLHGACTVLAPCFGFRQF